MRGGRVCAGREERSWCPNPPGYEIPRTLPDANLSCIFKRCQACHCQMLGSRHLPGPALHSFAWDIGENGPCFTYTQPPEGAGGSLAFRVPLQGDRVAQGTRNMGGHSWHTARFLVGPGWLLASTGSLAAQSTWDRLPPALSAREHLKQIEQSYWA